MTRLLERKAQTRRKIQLGGLIIKAGLSEEATAVLYGLLLEAAEKLQSEDAIIKREQWRLMGDLGFTRNESAMTILKHQV